MTTTAPRVRVTTYLPTPADAPIVTVHDDCADESWFGVIHDGIVHDASGVIDPDDIGWRFRITNADETVDLTGSLASHACCDPEQADAYGHEADCENYDGAPDAPTPDFPGYCANH